MKKNTSFRAYHLEKLTHKKHARAYMQAALEAFQTEGDKDAFLLALRDIAEAQGGLSMLSQKTGLNRQNLYKALSARGNPRLDTIGSLLHGLGYKLSVESIQP